MEKKRLGNLDDPTADTANRIRRLEDQKSQLARSLTQITALSGAFV